MAGELDFQTRKIIEKQSEVIHALIMMPELKVEMMAILGKSIDQLNTLANVEKENEPVPLTVIKYNESWYSPRSGGISCEDFALCLTKKFEILDSAFEPSKMDVGVCKIKSIICALSDGYFLATVPKPERILKRFSNHWRREVRTLNLAPRSNKEWVEIGDGLPCIIKIGTSEIRYFRAIHIGCYNSDQLYFLIDVGIVYEVSTSTKVKIWRLPITATINSTCLVKLKSSKHLNQNETIRVMENIRLTPTIRIVGFEDYSNRMPFSKMFEGTKHAEKFSDKPRSIQGAIIFSPDDYF